MTIAIETANAIADEIKNDHADAEAATAAQIELGHQIARGLLVYYGRQLQLDVADEGVDMRYGMLRAIAADIGQRAGLGAPDFVRPNQYEGRAAPDDRSLASREQLGLAVREFLAALACSDKLRATHFEQLGLQILPVVRVLPMGAAWTAVGLRLFLPGTQGLAALWNVDSGSP